MKRAVLTEKQIVRRQRAMRAKEILGSNEMRDIFKMAEDRALKAMRAATTPTESWEARALLVGHDELLGLLWLVAKDEKNVDREVSREEALNAREEWRDRAAREHQEYLKSAHDARGGDPK